MTKPKDRKGKAKAFREKAKSKKVKNINTVMDNQKQVIRKATWSASDKFMISGEEYQALSQFANLVAPLVEMSGRIMGQAELDEKLAFVYAYADGSEVEPEAATAYEQERIEKLEKRREEIQKYMALLQEQNEKVTAELSKVTPEPAEEVPAEN
jgi:hypothetical protein